MFRLVIATLVLTSFALGSTSIALAKTPEGKCQQGRLKAAAKFESCVHKAESTTVTFGGNNFFDAPSRCLPKYTAAWTKLQAQASGTGSSCDHARYVDNGDGT